MKLYVLRDREFETKDGLPGILTVLETAWRCSTLELCWANNLRGKSCLMPDTYACRVWFSPTMKRNVLRIEDKHGRKDCLIHAANFAGTGEDDYTQIHGCTSVGQGYGLMKVPNSDKQQWAILKSSLTLDALLRHIGPGEHTIRYEWVPGAQPENLADLNPDSKKGVRYA